MNRPDSTVGAATRLSLSPSSPRERAGVRGNGLSHHESAHHELTVHGACWNSTRISMPDPLPQHDAVEMETVPTQAGYDRWAEFYDSDDNPLVLLEEQHI